MPASGCVFCGIVAGQVPGDVVYQDAWVTAFRDLRPQAPVHVLVIPNEHYDSVAQLGENQAELLGKVFAAANYVAEREGVARSGFRLVVNRGRDGGQSVDHFHVHLLGARTLRWPPG